jgi:hypothetical protein
MRKILTFCWTEQHPEGIEHAAPAMEGTNLVPYLRGLRANAIQEQYSYAVYDRSALPWRLIVAFDVTTGTACNEVESVQVPA